MPEDSFTSRFLAEPTPSTVEEVPYSTWSQDNIFEDPIESYSKYMDHIREQYVEAGEYNVDIEKSITQNFYGELVRQNLIDPNKLDDFKTVDTKIRKFELPDFEDQVENLYKEDLTKKGIRKILDEDERNLFKGYLADVQAGEEISEEQQNIVKETYRKKRNKILKQQFVRGEINAAVLEDDEGNFQFFGGHIPEGQSYMDVLRNAQAQGTGVRISDLPNLVAAQKKLPAFKNKTQAEVMRLTALAGEVQAHLKKDEGLKNKLAGLSRARVEAEDGFWDNTKDVAESALGFMFDIGTAVFGSDEAQANRNVQSAIKRYSNSVEITKESLKSELATLTGASDKDVEQVIDQLSIDQADFKFYEDDLKLNLREGIYKQPKIHTSLLHQPKLLDRAIAEADLDDEVAESLRASREIFAAEDYSRVNKLLQEDGDTADDWNEFYLNNKKEGIEDHKILEKFAEEYDFNGFVDKLEGIGYSLYSGTIGTAATIIGSITGIDTLREYGVEVITNEQKRRQVGGVFGVEYGSMYDLATTAVPMVTDMAATVFLSKFTAGVGGAVYAGAKASSVSAVRSIANNFVKGNLKLVGGETYKDVAQKLFKEGAIKNLDDAYGIVKNFNSVMAQRIGAAPAVFIPAASRSGANTYAAVNTLMTEKLTQDHKNADGSWQDGWSEERVKKEAHEKGISGMIYGGAFTGLLTAGFGLVGKGGFETAFLRNASYRQLKNVGERLLNREIADVVFVENLKKSFKTALAKQQLTGLSKITQGALSEGVEESIDEFANTLIQDIITSEATPMVDVLNQTFHAFFLGGVLGGGGVAVNRAAKTIAPDRFLDKKAAADFENEILEQYQRDVQGNKELIEAGAPLTAQAAAEYLSRYARTQPSAEQEAEKIIEPFVEDEVNEESEILNNDLNNIDRDEVENAFNEELEKSEKGKDPVDPEVAISEDAQQIIKENGLDVDEALGKILKPHYAPSPKEVQERYTEKEKDIKQRLETWEAVNRIKDPEKQQETKIALKQVGYNILNPSQAKAAVKKLRTQTERDLKAIEQAEKDGLTETDMHLVETLASEGVSKSLDQSTLKELDVKPSKSDPAFIKVLEKKVKQRIKSKYPTRPVRLPEGGYEIPRGEGKSTLKVKSNGVGVFNNDPESMIALLQLGVPVEVDSVTEQTNPSFKWEQKGNKFILRDVVVRESGGMISATTSNNDVAVLEEDYTDLINDAKKLNELNQIDNPNLDVQIKSPFDRRRKATVRDLIEVSKDPLELKKLLAKSNTKVDDLDKPFFDSAVTYLSVQLQLRFRNYAEALGQGLAVDLNFTANSVASDVVEYLYKQQQARKDYQVRSTVESIDTDRTNKVDLNEDVDRTEMSEDTYVPVSFSSDPSLRDPSVIREYLTQQQDAAAAALESDPEMTQALRAAMTEAGHGYANQLSGEALFAAHVSELARTGNFNKQKSIYQFHSRLKAGEFDKGKVLSDSLFFLNLSHKFNRAADQSPTTKKEAAARVKEKLESITGKKILEPEAINFYTQVKKQINKFLQRGVADKRSRKAIEAANDSQVEELGLRDGSPDHVIKALEKIAKGKNKVQAIIARVLLHNRALLKTIDFTLEKSSATYAGKYFINNEGKGHVVINLSRTGGRGIADTLLHEYIHAFSSRITQLDPSQRTTAENNAIARLEGLLKIVRKQAAADKAPASIQAGLANVDEFISYFLTSPKFQGYIKSMTLKEGRSFFDRIIDAIARLFRQPTNEREYNAALRDVLDITKRGMLVREPDSSAGFRDQVAEGIEQSQKERDGISKLLSMEADIRDLEMLDEKAAELEIFVGNYVPSEVAVFSNNDIPTIARWNPQTQAIEFNGRRAAAFLNEALTNNGGYPINEEQVIGILINEELAHAASFASLSQDSINTIIDSMDDAQAKIVIEEYYPEDEQADALKRLESDDPQVVKNQKYILAEEMMRMFFQKKTRGTTSEEVVSFLIESPTNLEIFKQYLKNTFSRLSYHKEAKHISPEMRNGIKRVLNEVRRMEAGYRTRMNGMYFDTANPNATVNQLIDQLSRNKSLDFLEEDDIAPDLETRIGSTALITAPLRVDELRTLSKQEMVKRVDSAKYIHLQQAFDDIAEAYGLTVDTRSPLIGGYLEPVDKTDPDYEGKTEEELRQLATLSTEVPERVFVEGATEEELREIALLIKVLAPEVQHSTLLVKYLDEEAGAQEIEVRIKTKGAEKARMMAEDWLKDKNAGGFSYDPTTREINTLLLEPEEEGDPTVDEQLNTWNTFVDEQKQKGNIFKNAQSESTYVSTQFVGGKLEDVQAEVQRIRDKARQQDNAALLEVSERTLKRIDQEKDAEKIQSKAKKILEKRTLSPLSSKTIAKETKGKSFETIRDFGKFLDDRFESIEGVRQLSEQADEGIDDRAAKAAIPLVDDILTGLSESGSGKGWYDGRVQATLHELTKVYPELADSPNELAIFVGILATTSQGQKVVANFRFASQVYEDYKATGKIQSDYTQMGEAQGAINGNLKFMQDLIDRFQKETGLGKDEFTKFMDSEILGGALRDMFGKAPTGVTLKETVVGARMLGPKIGSFFNNLRRRFDTITMDLWYTRTMHRYIGNSVLENDAEAVVNAREKFIDALRVAERKYELDPEELETKDFEEVFSAAKQVFRVWASGKHPDAGGKTYKRYADGYEIEKAARTITTTSEMKKAPKNKSHSLFFERIVREAQSQLKDLGIDLNAADIQAILWFREKNLFKGLGLADSAAAPADYLDAAMVLRREKAQEVDEETEEPVPPALETRFGAGKFPSDHTGLKSIIDGGSVRGMEGIPKGMKGKKVSLSHTNITLGRLSREGGESYDPNYPVGVMPFSVKIEGKKYNAFNVRLKDVDKVPLSDSVYNNFLSGGNKFRLDFDMSIEELLSAINSDRSSVLQRIGMNDLMLTNPELRGKTVIKKGTVVFAQGAKGVVGGPAGTLVSYNEDISIKETKGWTSLAYNPALGNYMYPVTGDKDAPSFETNKEFVGADELVMISDLGKKSQDEGINFMIMAKGARFKNLTEAQVKQKSSASKIKKAVRGRATSLQAPALETQFGAESYIPPTINSATIDFSEHYESLDVPLLEVGTFRQPSSFLEKALIGETDREIIRFKEERDGFVRAMKDVVTKFKKNFDKEVADFEAKSGITLDKELIGRATGSTRGSQLTDDQENQVSEKFESDIKKARQIDDTKERSASFRRAEETRRKMITDFRNRNREILLDRRDKALKELSTITGNSPEIVQIIVNARAALDELSKKGNEVFKDYVGGFDVKFTFDGNLGLYLTRRYRMFEDVDFARAVREDPEYAEVRSSAVNFFDSIHRSQRINSLMNDGLLSKSEAEEVYEQELDMHVNDYGVTHGQIMMEEFIKGYESGKIRGGLREVRGADQEERLSFSYTEKDKLSQPFKAYLDQLKKKQNVPVELRNLLGEIKEDAGIDNLLVTLMSTSSVMANQAMLNRMKQYGTQGDNPWLVTQEQIDEENELAKREQRKSKYDDFVLIKADASDVSWNPLRNFYTSPEVYEGVQKLFALDTNSDEVKTIGKLALSRAFRGLQVATGTSMGFKTLGSLPFYIRNLVGNAMFFGPMQGYLGGIETSLKEVGGFTAGVLHFDKLNGELGDKAKKLKENSMLVRAFGGSRAEMDRELLFLNGQNIWGDELRSEILKDFIEGRKSVNEAVQSIESYAAQIKKLAPKGIETVTGKVKEKVNYITQTAAALASAVDAYYKIGYYQHELGVLRDAAEADPPDGKYRAMLDENGQPSFTMKRMAAIKVKRTSQSYSQATPIIKDMTRGAAGIFVGAFARFSAEVVRIPTNTFKLGMEELRDSNSVIQKRGRRRLIGMGSVLGGVSIIVPTLLKAVLARISLDEEEAMRKSMPFYLEDNTFFYVTLDGELWSFDLTFVNPFAQFIDPTVRFTEDMLRGDRVDKALWNFTKGMFKPFVNEQILATGVGQVIFNKNDYGKQIYFEEDTLPEKFGKAVRHIYQESYEPRTFAKGAELKQSILGDPSTFFDSPLGIILTEFSPVRPYQVDLKKSLRSYLFKKSKDYREITQQFNRLFQKKALTEDDVRDIYEDIQNSRRRLNESVFKTLEGFKSLGQTYGGITTQEIADQAKASGMSKERFRLGSMGYMKTLRPSPPQKKKLGETQQGLQRLYQIQQLQKEFGDLMRIEK